MAFGYDIQILRDSFANAKAETVEYFPTGCQAQEVGNVYSETWGRGENFKGIRVFEIRFTDDDFVNCAIVYIATGKAVFGRDSRNFPTVESIVKGRFINTNGWGYEHSAISATEAAKEAAANVREAPPEQIEAATTEAATEAATEAWRTAEFGDIWRKSRSNTSRNRSRNRSRQRSRRIRRVTNRNPNLLGITTGRN